MGAIDALPGFRRRFRVRPVAGAVRAELEDDFHHMEVVVRHEDGVATAVEGAMPRAPWTTCPGASVQLARTFVGASLTDFPARGEKQANCTHLHDLATLAAAHAGDTAALTYDVLVSDPVEGRSQAELRRNGNAVFQWTLESFRITAPAELAGLRLDQLKAWIETLDAQGQEAARILRWGAMIAHGRQIPMEHQSDASKLPPNCFTFQPEKAKHAKRVGVIRDFTAEGAEPLTPPSPA